MSSSIINGGLVPIRTWAPAHEVESDAIAQLKAVASLPWVAHHVAVMPDVHVGRGATVGSVIALRGAVAPAAVGVDIGCGMTAVRTSLLAKDLPDNLRSLRSAMEKSIPVGRDQHDSPALDTGSADVQERGSALMEQFGSLEPRVQRLADRAACQLGTLGGGNHFIEVCLDTEEHVWLMLHSGSRHIGNALADLVEIVHELKQVVCVKG